MTENDVDETLRAEMGGRMSDFTTNDELHIDANRLRDENARLRDENERLRIERDTFYELYQMAYHPDHFAQVKAENAELRALCKSMRCALADHDDKVYLAALDNTLVGAL